jgi:chemotaxis protein MotD
LLAHIQARAAGGQSSFTLRLDPAELGEVAVRLTFRRDGGASILVEAQEPAALDALMREARGLESALRDAGLKVSEDAIRFSLKSDGHDASGQQGQTPQPGAQSRPGRPGHDAERAPEPDIHVERWRHARLALIA